MRRWPRRSCRADGTPSATWSSWSAPGRRAATASLRRLGQQRILWFRTGDDGSGEALGGVIRVDHLDEVAAAVRALGALGPDRITGRALEPAHARLYDQVVARIERARSERFLGGEQGAADTARARIQHGLANLPALCRWSGASALGGALAGTPMVIVAPGPSLARNIDSLAELQGRAILLALSHSLGPLRRAGVTPDFVLAADAHDVTHHLAGEDMSGMAGMVVAATAHPHMFHSAAPAPPGAHRAGADRQLAGPAGRRQGRRARHGARRRLGGAHRAGAGPGLGLRSDRLRRPRPVVSRRPLLRRLERRRRRARGAVDRRARAVARGLARSGPPRPRARGRAPRRAARLGRQSAAQLVSLQHVPALVRGDRAARGRQGAALQLQRGRRLHRRDAAHPADRADRPPAAGQPAGPDRGRRARDWARSTRGPRGARRASAWSS